MSSIITTVFSSFSALYLCISWLTADSLVIGAMNMWKGYLAKMSFELLLFSLLTTSPSSDTARSIIFGSFRSRYWAVVKSAISYSASFATIFASAVSPPYSKVSLYSSASLVSAPSSFYSLSKFSSRIWRTRTRAASFCIPMLASSLDRIVTSYRERSWVSWVFKRYTFIMSRVISSFSLSRIYSFSLFAVIP